MRKMFLRERRFNEFFKKKIQIPKISMKCFIHNIHLKV